jgi:hypothetical protein
MTESIYTLWLVAFQILWYFSYIYLFRFFSIFGTSALKSGRFIYYIWLSFGGVLYIVIYLPLKNIYTHTVGYIYTDPSYKLYIYSLQHSIWYYVWWYLHVYVYRDDWDMWTEIYISNFVQLHKQKIGGAT